MRFFFVAEGLPIPFPGFSYDLTQLVRYGKLKPKASRDKEINMVIEIISHKMRGNPLLVRNDEVGFDIVVGLAQKIVSNEVPDILRNKRIIGLDWGDLIRRSSFKERLALGDTTIIGLASRYEYAKYIRNDALLKRCFYPLFIEEPTREIISSLTERLVNFEEAFNRGTEGDTDIWLVTHTFRRAIAGFKKSNLPLGSFAFLGPLRDRGMDLARTLAYFLFNDEDAIIRVNMAQSRPIPDIIKSVLLEGVRRKPYSVLLFDEIDEAPSELLNALFQILRRGSLTDAMGDIVDFGNTIIIITSRTREVIKTDLLNLVDEII